MFYALLTGGTVYRKIVAFGQASISRVCNMHVEEWKYYELTNLKAKKPRDIRYMNNKSSSWPRAPRRRRKQRGPEDLKKIVHNFQKSWRWKIIINYEFPNELFVNKSSLSFLFSQKRKKNTGNSKKIKTRQTIIRLFHISY